MEIRKVWSVSFSPCGTTERAAGTIARILAEELRVPYEERSFTRPADREQDISFTDTDFAVIAFPTYAGKLPNKILPDLKARLRGNHTPAAAVVLFGNRAFDNALAELVSVLAENGFCPVSGAAFASRHTFTDTLGTGRPGWEDRREMEQFAKATAEKVRQLTELPVPVRVPGDAAAPYYVPRGTNGEAAKFLKAKPKTDPVRCCNCGVCARQCPMGAIDPDDVSRVPGTCIKCQSCVRRCTRRAKFFDDPAFLSHVAMLEQNFTEPKENRVFF